MGLAGSIPAGGKGVCGECFVLPGGGHCEGPITRPGVIVRKPRHTGALEP